MCVLPLVQVTLPLKCTSMVLPPMVSLWPWLRWLLGATPCQRATCVFCPRLLIGYSQLTQDSREDCNFKLFGKQSMYQVVEDANNKKLLLLSCLVLSSCHFPIHNLGTRWMGWSLPGARYARSRYWRPEFWAPLPASLPLPPAVAPYHMWSHTSFETQA